MPKQHKKHKTKTKTKSKRNKSVRKIRNKGYTRKLLPKLRTIDKSGKKYHYHISDSTRKRRRAIHEGVSSEQKKTGRTKKQAAIAKKARFNVLRIYRRNKKQEECHILTKDMKYMDKKYDLGTTKDICGK